MNNKNYKYNDIDNKYQYDISNALKKENSSKEAAIRKVKKLTKPFHIFLKCKHYFIEV